MIIVLYLITAATCIGTLFRPWIGVVAYYFLSIIGPQYIWPWIVGDFRISKIIVLATLVSTVIHLAAGRLSIASLKQPYVYCIVAIYCLLRLSDFLSPFQGEIIPSNMVPPDFIFRYLDTLLLMHLLAIMTIQTTRHLWYFAFALGVSTFYLTYWANMQYLSGLMYELNYDGRLRGPGGIYIDTNSFGLLFVIAAPFFIYVGSTFKNAFIRYGFWLCVPLIWHAAFLTGSRGALLSLGISTLFIAWQYRSKTFSAVLVLLFMGAVATQAGQVLDRTTDTVNTEERFEDKPLDPRILSWIVGLNIMKDYPLLGVGTGRFQQAYPRYQEGYNYVAHNTFLQFTANAGLPVGILMISIGIMLWRKLKRRPSPDREILEEAAFENDEHELHRFYSLRKACVASLVAFLVGSLFLDLMIWEPLYYLLAFLVCSFSIEDKLSEERPLGGKIESQTMQTHLS